jgi:MFS family permease
MQPKSSLGGLLNHPLILSFYMPAVIVAFSMGLLVPVLPLYAGGFGLSYGLVGVIMAGEALGTLIADVPAGVLVKRLGLSGGMRLGLACMALSTGALFWAGSVPVVVVCRLMAGFGYSIYSVSRHAFITGAARAGIRGRTIALQGGILRTGRFAGPMVGGAVAARIGLRAPFLLFAGLSGIALLVVLRFVPESETAEPSAASVPQSQLGSLLSTLKTHRGILTSAGAGQLFAQMIRRGRLIIIPLYAAHVIGLDVQAIGLVVSLASAVDMSLFYPAGLIMDRLGRKFAIVPSFMIQAVGMALLPLTQSFAALLGISLLIGFGNGLGSGSMMTLGADLAPGRSRGEFLGLWRWIGDVGATGGPLIVGSIADLVALPTAALMMSGAGLAAAAIFMLLVPETRTGHAVGG